MAHKSSIYIIFLFLALFLLELNGRKPTQVPASSAMANSIKLSEKEFTMFINKKTSVIKRTSAMLSSCAFMAGMALPALVAITASGPANAAVVLIPDPVSSTAVGARIRWGASGFEAGLYNGGTNVSNLNPVGAPVWALGNNYRFQVDYASVTGILSLGVDFNLDSSFGVGETLSYNSAFAGSGFDYLQITGNEGGSTARSTVSNLVINGSSQASLAPVGTFLNNFYDDTSGGATDWAITGELNFSTTGTAQERPSWNFNFLSPAAVVPVPGSLSLTGLGLLALAAASRRRRAQGRDRTSA